MQNPQLVNQCLPRKPPNEGPPHFDRKAHAKRRASNSGASRVVEAVPEPKFRFLQLSLELRNMVYDFVFLSTRITSGRIVPRHNKYIKPAQNSLALCYVCSQIFHETKTLWLERILFNFESIESLFDKLYYLPLAKRSQIRHLRTREQAWDLTFNNIEYHYKLASILNLLPGLRLDTLTVLSSEEDVISYNTLEGLVQHGNGWKELHYITPGSQMLGFGEYTDVPYRGRRQPQPNSWEDTLLSRDGPGSKATVAIYQADKGKAAGAPFTSNNSRPLVQTTQENFGIQDDVQLMSDQEILELLVVVKRGHNADIEVHDIRPYNRDDIRQQTNGIAWLKIKENLIANYGDVDDFPGKPTFKLDTYGRRDEYIWSRWILDQEDE